MVLLGILTTTRDREMTINTARHKDYFDPFKHRITPITIIGAGATGSRVFEALINLGLTDITVYDPDVIESHNLANQLYINDEVGIAKVSGLFNWEELNTGVARDRKYFQQKRVEGNMKSEVKGIVFLLTDTMSSRKEIWENSLRFNSQVSLVIETRMSLTHGNVMMFNPQDAKESKQWVDTLIDDDAPTTDVSLCGTALTIGTTACIIANLAVNQMIHHMRGDDPDPVIEVFLEPLFINTSRWET